MAEEMAFGCTGVFTAMSANGLAVRVGSVKWVRLIFKNYS